MALAVAPRDEVEPVGTGAGLLVVMADAVVVVVDVVVVMGIAVVVVGIVETAESPDSRNSTRCPPIRRLRGLRRNVLAHERDCELEA